MDRPRPSDILLTIEHPHGTHEVSLDQWMKVGPGDRPNLRPVRARRRETGEAAPLTLVPFRFRNGIVQRLLTRLRIMRPPW